MSQATPPLVEALVDAACNELDAALTKIRHCLDQLSDEQVWWRPDEAMNSPANLLLHLCGNLRQWVVSGIGGAPDTRDRPREFSHRGPISKEALCQRLEAAVAEVQQVLRRTTADELLRTRRIQGFDTTGVRAMLHAVSHFWGHTQEIVHLTRVQIGPNYRFHFVPVSKEQGAG